MKHLLKDLKQVNLGNVSSYRVVSTKYPPISLFDDVSSAEEFDALYELQALTNPRIQNEVGNLALLPKSDIPFGIRGCNYAVAPFVHISPDGSRFSDGQYGILYLADSIETALSEVHYHQSIYWEKIEGLHYERLVFKALKSEFTGNDFIDLTRFNISDAIYDSDDYSKARQLGKAMKKKNITGFQYFSVRNKDAICWGLLTPMVVKSMIQSSHYQMIWDGESLHPPSKISKV